MIILGYAYPADIAVISSFGGDIFTLKAIFFQYFLVFISQKFIIIFFLHFVRTFHKSHVENQHRAKDQYLYVNGVPLSKFNGDIQNGSIKG